MEIIDAWLQFWFDANGAVMDIYIYIIDLAEPRG